MAVFKSFHGGIPTFDPEGEPTSIAPRCRRWKRAFELFVVGKGQKPTRRKNEL
jgi:hypothetical protein